MDIVIPLGTGSKWKNNELRYCLRSIVKHLKGFRKIYIIGEKPDFLQWDENLVHLPYTDASAYNKEKNIFEKVLYACQQDFISPDFLFMNDDHFFLSDYYIPQFPYFRAGGLQSHYLPKPAGNTYRISLKNTFLALRKKEYSSFHFDVHCPIRYNKEKFIEIMPAYDWTIPYGYVVKSLYANSLGIKGRPFLELKISSAITLDEIERKNKNRFVFSIGDASLNNHMKNYLESKYPIPTTWEK